MTYTLFNATLDLARLIGNVEAGINDYASAPHATIVAALDWYRFFDDHFNRGTLWLTSGACAGYYASVADFARGTNVAGQAGITTLAWGGVTPPGTLAAGVAMRALRGDWPTAILVDCINLALTEAGEIPQINTALVTVANQEAYTLPAGVRRLLKVEIKVSGSNPVAYVPAPDWYEANGILYFGPGAQPDTAGLTIRLFYLAAHAALASPVDEISPYIHPERVAWVAAANAWRWRIQLAKGDEPTYKMHYEEALTRSIAERERHPLKRPNKTPRLSL